MILSAASLCQAPGSSHTLHTVCVPILSSMRARPPRQARVPGDSPKLRLWTLSAPEECAPSVCLPLCLQLTGRIPRAPSCRVSWLPWAQLPAVMATGSLELFNPGTRESKLLRAVWASGLHLPHGTWLRPLTCPFCHLKAAHPSQPTEDRWSACSSVFAPDLEKMAGWCWEARAQGLLSLALGYITATLSGPQSPIVKYKRWPTSGTGLTFSWPVNSCQLEVAFYTAWAGSELSQQSLITDAFASPGQESGYFQASSLPPHPRCLCRSLPVLTSCRHLRSLC